MPNWAEQVTAIATAVLAIGAVGAIGAAVFAAQQVREARIGREAEVASEFFRRWSDDPMVETRRLVATFRSPDALRDALLRHTAANDTEAYVLYRELDYFEQLGALEDHGGLHFGKTAGGLFNPGSGGNHSGTVRKSRFDLVQLDAESSDLHLPVATPVETHGPILW